MSSNGSGFGGHDSLGSGNGAGVGDERRRSKVATADARAPYYHDALVELYNRDATDLSFLADQSVHLVVTSPPYNLGKDYGTARDNGTYFGYLDWVEQWCRSCIGCWSRAGGCA